MHRDNPPLAADLLQHAGRHGRRRVDALTTEFDETQHSDAVADEHPEGVLLRTDAKETLGRALDRLAPEFREVIVLRELQGLSYKEISEVAGVPVGTVMSRLARAREQIRSYLDGERPALRRVK